MPRETHPNWHHRVPDMRVLILGTFPPHEGKRHYPFFYPNKQNRFWPTLAAIAGKPLTEFRGESAVEERKKLMELLRVGVQNVGLTIDRKGQSSLDSNIKIVQFQDILKTIREHKDLRAIHLTGFTGPSSTASSFVRYLDQCKISHGAPKKFSLGDRFAIDCGREIMCFVGNSTSTAARTVRPEALVAQFKRALEY